MTEQELAKYIITWLEERGWEVFQEVSTGALSPIADIVAVKNGLTWIIETKTRYGLAVIDQGCFWMSRHCANYVSIAVCRSKKRKGAASWFFHREKGVGLMMVDFTGHVSVSHDPKLIRTKKEAGWNVKNFLCNEHKHFAKAGAANGGYFTPFKATVRDVKRYIEKNPGTTIKEMVDTVGSYHYSSDQTAKACIAKYIRDDVIDGVVIKIDGRKHRLYLAVDKDKPVKSVAKN